jgi:hypothetical protein
VDAIVVTPPAQFSGESLGCPVDYPYYVMERVFFGTGTGCDCLGVRFVTGANRFNVD